jgi:hypothetical protein
MAFLLNYLGEAYTRLLSSMPKYECIAFGEGISCDAPVVIRLNDPERFRTDYWDPAVPNLRPARLQQTTPAGRTDANDPAPDDPTTAPEPQRHPPASDDVPL